MLFPCTLPNLCNTSHISPWPMQHLLGLCIFFPTLPQGTSHAPLRSLPHSHSCAPCLLPPLSVSSHLTACWPWTCYFLLDSPLTFSLQASHNESNWGSWQELEGRGSEGRKEGISNISCQFPSSKFNGGSQQEVGSHSAPIAFKNFPACGHSVLLFM